MAFSGYVAFWFRVATHPGKSFILTVASVLENNLIPRKSAEPVEFIVDDFGICERHKN